MGDDMAWARSGRPSSGHEMHELDRRLSNSVEQPELEEETEPFAESSGRRRHTGERSSSDTQADTRSSHEESTISTPHRRDTTTMIRDEDMKELQRIATVLSRQQSNAAGDRGNWTGFNAFDDSSTNPALDPQHKDFDITKWLRLLIQTMNAEGVKSRSTGLVFKNLDVFGSGPALQLQNTVADFFTAPLRLGELFGGGKKQQRHILQSFNGVLKSGELLIVLGRPGSGCSTLLKSMSGELHGLNIGKKSTIHYNGISQDQMMKEFKGEASYNQEVDKHFPHLTVGQTLQFAVEARAPSQRLQGVSRDEFCRKLAQVVMAICGLSHTVNTKVGNDYVRGVSGGERKRVSIAEMILAGSPFSAWDNSTRGLDSATALKFVQSLRLGADLADSAHAVAIYQASQSIYDIFDKATVLYEGRQIYFGPANGAKSFFERQGWHCPQRQTTGDFLTSITNSKERRAREGMENKVPRTPLEFETYWRQSPEFKDLESEIELYEQEFLVEHGGESITLLRQQKNQMQAKNVRPKSPYIISIAMQVKLTTRRAYQRIWGDISATATNAGSNIIMALILGSLFYNTPEDTGSFFSRGSVLFMAVLFNGLSAISEISSLYAQRPIVEKHVSYAFYHPATEAIAGIVADVPIKFIIGAAFNLTLYFMANLRREPGAFFLYFLITFVSTFVMSAMFRTMAAVTKTVSQAMALSGVLILALVIYTGFVIAVPQMRVWFSWLRYINPLYFAFEIVIANEFHGRNFACSSGVPSYSPPDGDSWICSIVGAVAGQSTVSGDDFIEANYRYYNSNIWRNFGILMAFLVFFMVLYFVATELNSSTGSVAEVLVFQRGHVPAYLQKGNQTSADEEISSTTDTKTDSQDTEVRAIEPQKDIFTWRDIVYDIHIKDEPRRLLDHVSGWVKPGTLTALMGVSGAGKTTLLDVLAQRTTMGVITGDMFVNGKPLDDSFQRKTGYVQQQDLHLETATVRESLQFSAELRQPNSVSKEEKFQYVEEVIKMLGMGDFANAIVGVPGEGLNVEQRKLLTIGVELAAKPKLLLFLDEPTSGLDSQSSWAICAFLRKLADAGQAVLCTVHQPSAILFQEFDRLLFLAKGGKTVYFGNVGENSRFLLDYFESNGARKCGSQENPAEYMLEIVANSANGGAQDWHEIWKSSEERRQVEVDIDQMHAERINEQEDGEEGPNAHAEFAMPFTAQLKAVTVRVFQQYWRMPAYIFSKWMLGICAGLFIGFSFFRADTSQAGMQTVLFSVFMITTMFTTVVQQIQPMFVSQRSLYEVRERPSKAYSWKAFLIANILVEIPYQIITGILVFACVYYPVAGVQSSSRQVLVLLFLIQFFIYASSFAHMTIAAFPDVQTAAGVLTLLIVFSLMFCGVIQSPSALPRFWIFMYRVSPFTYWIGGIVSTQLHGRLVACSTTETSIFDPPAGETCGQYLADFLATAPGQLQNPNDTSQCQYCALTVADQFMAGSNIFWSERWRNFGIMWVYVIFNIVVAVLSYYIFRVAKWNLGSLKSKKSASKKPTDTEKGPSQGTAAA